MANIAAQAASQGLTGSQVAQQSMFGGTGMMGQFGTGMQTALGLAQQQAQNSAANQAQNIAQQQLGGQGISTLSQAQNAITGGISGIANQIAGQVQGAGAAEQAGLEAAVEAGGNPYADNESNMLTAGMAVGDAPIATAGNFNPQTEIAAARMFGPQKYKRKPLITF
tara:strand:- start:2390 stop:2890 length:501 start_codon:yes stop_codon:yes gene_type:complete